MRMRCVAAGEAHSSPAFTLVFTVHPAASTERKFPPATARSRVCLSHAQGCHSGPRSSRPHCRKAGLIVRSGSALLRTESPAGQNPPPGVLGREERIDDFKAQL